MLLGVRAVIAESFERIHRSNLVGMGVLPLEFVNGETRQSLGLTGFETYDVLGLDESLTPQATLVVKATAADGSVKQFSARAASIRRKRCSTTRTAAFCRTCCAASWGGNGSTP